MGFGGILEGKKNMSTKIAKKLRLNRSRLVREFLARRVSPSGAKTEDFEIRIILSEF